MTASASKKTTDAPYDAVILGGGISGLAAAWHLRHRQVLLLEAEQRLGGRLYSESRGEYWLNYGAHMFPSAGGVVDAMARDVGLETQAITGSMMGVAFEDRIVTNGPIESYPLRLPLSMSERLAFAKSGLRVQRAVSRYYKIIERQSGESEAEAHRRGLAYLDSQTFAEFLGPLPPKVASIFACASHRATAEATQLSAGGGIRLFALVWAGRASLIARNLVGGSSVLPDAIGRVLEDKVLMGAEARRITEGERNLAKVEYSVEGKSYLAEARHVIVAVPAPIAGPLVAEMAPEASVSLSEISYGPFLSMAILTNETGPMPWDGVYALATPGRSFDMFTNQAQILRRSGQRAPGGSLMIYAGADNADRMQRLGDDEIRARFLTDLHSLYPDTLGVVADTKIQRWKMGNVFAHPGRHRLQASLEGPLGASANLHLAGDYLAVALGSMEAAAKAGNSAARVVNAAL